MGVLISTGIGAQHTELAKWSKRDRKDIEDAGLQIILLNTIDDSLRGGENIAE